MADRPISTVGVVGAGNMGSGIAQKTATEGWPVIMVDTAEGIARAETLLNKSIEEGLARGIYNEKTAQQLRDRITTTTDYGMLAKADLVIEAVFEDEAVKTKVFEQLDEHCPKTTIFATNTSSLSVARLAEKVSAPERVIGLHYFYHPAKNRLVEVVPSAVSNPQVIERAWRFCESSGKTPIHALDRPGFIVNRFFVPWLNEACRLLEEGLDIPSIEAGAKQGLGTAFGPFELMNMTGIPIALHAQSTLHRELGDFYQPSERLRQQVNSGEQWVLEGSVDEANAAKAQERLNSVVFWVALCLNEEGVGTPEDTDIGARVGLRWPMGPFERMNTIGLDTVLNGVKALTQHYDLHLPESLPKHVAGGQPFDLKQVNSSTTDGVTTITLNRPDALNALSPGLVSEFAERFDSAVSDTETRAIILRGAGKAFVAGADLKFFKDNLDADRLDDIISFTGAGQELFQRIDDCPKRVVVVLDGLSLGGGSELALCADVIIATEKGSMGFPETGLGIYPGLGGTQRAARRCGVSVAQWLVLSGQVLGAKQLIALGLADDLVARDQVDQAAHSAALAQTAPKGHVDYDSPIVTWANTAFDVANIEKWLSGAYASSDDAQEAKLAKKLGFKAPIALRIASELVAASAKLEIPDGCAEELRRLPEVFHTQDALEGITSVLERRRPTFKGN